MLTACKVVVFPRWLVGSSLQRSSACTRTQASGIAQAPRSSDQRVHARICVSHFCSNCYSSLPHLSRVRLCHQHALNHAQVSPAEHRGSNSVDSSLQWASFTSSASCVFWLLPFLLYSSLVRRWSSASQHLGAVLTQSVATVSVPVWEVHRSQTSLLVCTSADPSAETLLYSGESTGGACTARHLGCMRRSVVHSDSTRSERLFCTVEN